MRSERLPVLAATAVLLVQPVQAADYAVMGAIDAVIGPEPVQLWVPLDLAEDDAHARKIGFGVTATYTVVAMSGVEGTAPSFPRLSLTFMRPGPDVVALELTYEPAFGAAFVADAETADFSMQNVSVDGDLVRFTFSATVVELDTATYETAEDASTIDISGMGRVTFRE